LYIRTGNDPIAHRYIFQSEFCKTGFDMGAVDYITKPFEIEELKARVTNHLLVKKAQENLLMQKNILEKKVD